MVEQVDVKCNRCRETCYGEVISTYGKYYHQYCFACTVAGCKQDLAQVGFFHIEGKIYCRNDYHKMKGIKCGGCAKYVEGEAISAAEVRFHPTCFGCTTCGKVFPAGSEICFDGEDFFCLRCNISPRAPPIQPPPTQDAVAAAEIPKVDVVDSNINDNISDREPSTDDRVTNTDGKPAAKCAGCENYIKTGQALLALDKQWHLWCFTCYKCGALLTGEYMGRDGIPYCEKDYQSEFGISCAGCGDYITGKVLQAGEKHYHPSCSRCAKCGDMFGEGEDMYLQGSEIWHPHCSEEQVVTDRDESDGSKSDESELDGPTPIHTPIKAKETENEPEMFFRAGTAARESTPAAAVDTIPEPKPSRPLSQNLNPIPFGKPAGFRSVKPPGFRSVKPPVPAATSQPAPSKSSGDETDDAPPPVPPPPARSTSSQWRQKYAPAPRNSTPKSDDVQNRPKSCAESRHSDNTEDDKDLKSTLSYSTDTLNSNSSGSYRKGIGYNQLKHRIISQKDKKPAVRLPTNIDPDRLRQFLDDPDHNVYLEDHEFYQLFKITREKFYSLPQSKKQELKSGFLFA